MTNKIDDYQARKEKRRLKFHQIHGVKLSKCYACNGSGYYDHNNSPRCSACDGTGKILRIETT